MAIVKVRLADLFDGPADMIVLPCSTAGTVSNFVARSLNQHSLPQPPQDMMLGDVEIMPFRGGENIAQYVAFAATVMSHFSSSLDAIEHIGSVIGDFTREQPSVRTVSMPLLGAGAGGIMSEKVVVALQTGFSSSADPSATLVVHVLNRDTFDRLKSNRQPVSGATHANPRVFISHTASTNEAVEWVRQLAQFLIDNGVQARLDRLHLRHGMDLPQWMCNELALADKVIVVCDEIYKKKAEGRLGGVGWETMIMQGDIAALPPDSTKYQIIVRTEDISMGLPFYLRTKYAFHAPPSNPTQTFRTELLSEIAGHSISEPADTGEFVL